jgi:asparagine synthetase B (glutamine-hydrolysing)
MRLFEPVLFRDGRPVAEIALADARDPRGLVGAHAGHFALHERAADGSHWLVRDLLGVHKLFFAMDHGRIEVSNYLVDLLRAGHACERVLSVPAGHYVHVHPDGSHYELARWGQLRFGEESTGTRRGAALDPFAAPIRVALERAFRLLALRFAGRPVYVTLSGGLDSTTIAALAREHFPGLCTVTFALRDPREAGPGADLFFARRVATDLGLAHLEVLADPDEVLGLLDEVLVYGQDYRDFNVHCALVNAALGRAIAARHPTGPRPVVLSGDVMNELLADYAPVRFQGREYFGLPRLDQARTRRFLVGGLDSGDREVGIFARFGVETAQPYALCAREYAALPASLACAPGSKSRLVRAVMGRRIPAYVLARPKVRAQVAVEGEPGGTLALLVKRGIDQPWLKQRFASLLGIDPRAAGELMRAGSYRFRTSAPAAVESEDAWTLSARA